MDLLIAKMRGVANPCPPHEYHGKWKFCVKCGEYQEKADGGSES